MRIGIDIDDVLYPWYDTAHQLSERAGITNGVTPSSWQPWADYGCSKTAWLNVCAEGTLSGELYRAEPLPGATDQLSRLRAGGHSVHLVTARGFMRNGTRIRHLTVEWLTHWGIPHDSLTFIRDKRLVAVDVFLDDAVHNYDQLADHTEVWMVHAPHNGAHHEGRRVVASLAEFVDLVLERGAVPA